MTENQFVITEEALNNIENKMRAGSERYAIDELDGFFSEALKKYPLNTKPEIAAMKIALVDTTNSTNLSRLLGNKEVVKNGQLVIKESLTLTDLINKIVSMTDFDERIKNGDVTLVDELTKWGSKKGLKLMSFFSKYCLYHNYYVYDKDDFVIFDTVVKNSLGKYLNKEEFQQLYPNYNIKNHSVEQVLSNKIEKMRLDCNYQSYYQLVNNILKIKKIDPKNVPKMRRKLDLLVWYQNR